MGKMESKSLIYSLFEDNYVQIIIVDASFIVEIHYNKEVTVCWVVGA